MVAGAVCGLAAVAVAPLVNRKSGAAGAQADAATTAPLPVVQVAAAQARPMARTLRLAGTLKSGSEASLSPKQGGKIAAVLVTEGQAVRQGQVLVRLDPADAKRQSEQATAGVAAARANWQKALDGEKLKRLEIDRRITEAQRGVEQARLQVEKAEAGIRLQKNAAEATVAQAQAGLDAAKSALAQAKRGARLQQKRQAEIGVRQAQRGVSLAKKNLDDLEFLHSKGGVPRIQVDEAREGYQKALDGLAQARAQLELLEAGASAEEIAAAEAQVRSAAAGLEAARAAAARDEVDRADLAAARTQLQRAEDGLRAAEATRAELDLVRSDIRAARAAFEQAEAAARLAAQQVTSADIVSPVDGVVSAVTAHVGEMAGPGHPLVKVTGSAGVYLDAAAPSRLLADLREGQEAEVLVDALPGRKLRGTVRSVGNVAARDGRSFPVRIDLSAPAGLLKPGGFARAEVVVERFPAAVTAAVQALRTDGETTSVWVVRRRKVVEVPVRVPTQDDRYAALQGEIAAGEAVIMSSTPGLRPGDEVETRRWD